MIFSDYTETELKNFDSILENYGVKRAEGLVFEGDTQHYAMQMPYYIVPSVKLKVQKHHQRQHLRII